MSGFIKGRKAEKLEIENLKTAVTEINSEVDLINSDLSEAMRTLPDVALMPSGTDDSQAINAKLLQSSGILKIKNGSYKSASTIVVQGSKSVVGENLASTIIECSGNGAGLLMQNSNGTRIKNLNFNGSKTDGIIKIQDAALFRIEDVVCQNNQSSVIRIGGLSQDSIVSGVDFLQCGSVYPASKSDGAVIFIGEQANNIYFFYARIEAPRNTGIYAKGNTIRYFGGKIDGSFGGNELTTNPFVVSDGASLEFDGYTLTGFRNYPIEIIGSGLIEYKGVIGNGMAPAVFFSENAAYKNLLYEGGLPGSIIKPGIKASCQVVFKSTNTPSNVIGSVISLRAPQPLVKPNAGNNGVVTITGAFDTGNGVIQADIKEWNGSAFVAPQNNDRYTGCWLVDFATGNAFAKITTQAGGLCQFVQNGLAASGEKYFVQYDNVHGIRLDIDVVSDVDFGMTNSPKLVEIHMAVQISGALYNADIGTTTIQLAESVQNDSLIGYFVLDQQNDDYFYISGNSGNQIAVMHNREAKLPAGSYKITKGNPKAGKGIKVSKQ